MSLHLMFWQSTFAMTVVDVLVMSIAGYTLRVLYRHRVDLRVRRAISGALLIALGVALFGAFYSVDLFTMHGLPLLIPREDAITAMRHLHLDVNWLVTIAAMASIVVGFLLNNRKLLSLIGRLESTQSGLVEEVAERKQAEEALQHSKRRLASAHHVAKLAHWDRHPKDDRLVFSRNAAFILGVSSDELPDHNSRLNQQFVHPEDRADHMATTDQPFYEAVDYELQYRIIRPDGEVRHIFEIAEVVFDDSGQRVGMSGTIQDITEREQIKEALQTSEARLAGIIDNAPEAIISIDQSQRIVLFNQGAEAIFGYSADEVIGKSLKLLLPARLREIHDKHIESFARSSMPRRQSSKRPELAGLRRDGSEFPIEASLTKLQQGKETIFTAMMRDITERKASEEALRESEARLQAILDYSPTKIHIKDAVGRYTVINRESARLFGLSNEEIIGKTTREIFPKEMADRFLDHDATVLKYGQAVEQEEEWVTENGIRTYLTVKFPILDADGQVGAVGAVGTDITERKRTKDELVSHRDRLEELVMARTAELERRSDQLEQALSKERALNELQRQFVSMVSHEFRTPLTIIEGSAQRMMRRADRLTPDDVQQRTGRIRSAVKRMTGLIESTLSVSRLDAGKFEMNPTYIDAAELVAENCRLQREISASHAISVDVGAISRPIYADSDLLNQIFANLLSNAIKYSPNGCTIEVWGYIEDEQVLVSIRDYGLGISANDVPRLFERFFRAGTSTGIAGTGIGLHLVKQLVELHGGSIAVESVEGKGSTFTVGLPIEPAKDVIAHGPVGTASPAHITVAEEPGGRRQRWP